MNGGVRQRLGIGGDAGVRGRSRSPPRARAGGGVRQQLGLASSSGATAPSQPPARSSGVRQRLRAIAVQADAARTDTNKPLNKLLRQKWGDGSFSAPTVCEVANAASSQGARGARVMGGSAHNAHRHLIAAIGYPDTAAEIDWVYVPDAKGEKQPHPILCPIK
eukprot:5915891-Pyramimonas_sp.AAC.1